MGSLSIRLKNKPTSKNPKDFFVHDLRLYSPEELPKYIDPSRTKNNILLISSENLPTEKAKVEDYIKSLEEENKALFETLKQEGVIPKNQGYKIARPVVGGILTLSHEAQEKLKDPELLEEFLLEAKRYLKLLANALGTDILYAVVHLDETAPHIHFALRNLVYKETDREAIYELGWEDLEEPLKRARGKAISNVFYGNSPKAKNPRSYQIPFSRLQDSLEYFRPKFGFGRGKPKKERIKEGEPVWKWTNRSVRKLHEDLPKEIELLEDKARKLRLAITKLYQDRDRLNREIKELEERKSKLEETKALLEGRLKTLEEEVRKKEEYLSELQQKANAIEDSLSQKTSELEEKERKLSEITKKISEIQEKLLRLQDTLKKLSDEEREKKARLRELERSIHEKQQTLESYERKVSELEQKKEELEKEERYFEERKKRLEYYKWLEEKYGNKSVAEIINELITTYDQFWKENTKEYGMLKKEKALPIDQKDKLVRSVIAPFVRAIYGKEEELREKEEALSQWEKKLNRKDVDLRLKEMQLEKRLKEISELSFELEITKEKLEKLQRKAQRLEEENSRLRERLRKYEGDDEDYRRSMRFRMR